MMTKNVKFLIQESPVISLAFVIITIMFGIVVLGTTPTTLGMALTTPQESQMRAQATAQTLGQQMIKIVDSIGSHLNQSRYALQTKDVQTGLLYLEMAEKNLTSLRKELLSPVFSQMPGTTTPGIAPSRSFSSPSSSSPSGSSGLPPALPPGPPPPPPSSSSGGGVSGSIPSQPDQSSGILQPGQQQQQQNQPSSNLQSLIQHPFETITILTILTILTTISGFNSSDSHSINTTHSTV